jgi:two-component system sensor histidine kinase KdpD
MSTERPAGAALLARRRPVVRVAAFVVGVALVWAAAAVASSYNPLDLAAVLLVMLAVVVALALVTGPVLAVVASLAVVVIVNWYLVPPYGTFTVASTENLVALIVFPLVAAVTAGLVEVGARARARDAASSSRAELMGDVAADASGALERVRRALDLDELRLVSSDGAVVAVTGATSPSHGVVLDAPGPDGYRLVGTGVPRMAEDPGFIASLAATAVRAHESGELEREKDRAAALAAADEARSALLASVGHDLRTPLAGLRLAVDTLRSPDVELDDAARDELLGTVDASTTRLDELISNLLDMSRLEAGGLPVRREAVALYGVVSAAVAGRPAGAVLVHVDDVLPLVSTDPVLLERVVENLVSNALRHGRAGAGRPVEVRATPRTTAVVLDVVDHGPGLRQEAAASPPLTASRSADGSTGLGLEIVRRFCAAMDAQLELRETEGGGLTARVTLPIARGGAR